MNLSHDEIKSLIAPYVLGAVSEEEMATVRAHIATCDECLAEADGYSDVVSSLALAVEQDDLPEGFIDEVMSEARTTEESRAPDSGPAPVIVLPKPDAPPLERVVPLRARRTAPLLAAAAVVILVAVLSIALIDARSDLGDARSQLALQTDRLTALAEDQGGMRLAGEGRAVMLPTTQGGIFLASGLAEAPDDRTYQVWLLQEGEDPASAGTFDVSDGIGTLATDRSLEGVQGVAVTIERAGGAAAPTSDPILTTS
ncbi:MAG: anti-sigma factor domain-containing protein [Actinomycetota bacterium]